MHNFYNFIVYTIDNRICTNQSDYNITWHNQLVMTSGLTVVVSKSAVIFSCFYVKLTPKIYNTITF